MNSTTITAPHTQAEIFKQFALYGDLISFKPFGSGHINGTYLSVWNQAGTSVQYTHQRINKKVFTNPAAVVENIQRITEHIAAKLTAEAEPAATIANQGAAAMASDAAAGAESQASAAHPLANVSVSKPGSDETVEAAAHTQHKAAPPAATASATNAALGAASRPAAHTALAAKSAAAANHGMATTAINQTAAATAPDAETKSTAPCTATHPSQRIGTAVPVSRQVLTLIPAKDGRYFYVDSVGEYWRTYLFIEDAATYDRMENPALARKAGTAIGAFQRLLSDYSGPSLHETIPNFHNMHSRYAQLDQAAARNAAGRLAEVREELAFLEANRARGMILSDGLANGTLPRSITHNDTKLNNILFDAATDNTLCIIDLDTVMPGTRLFDTGDLIRTSANTASEDEADITKVRFDIDIFAALIEGYLSASSGFLTAAEKSLIAESGRTLTQIMAVRFLTDYLNGDIYYKTARPSHNLDRARTQIALIRSMDSQWERLLHITGRTS